MVALVKLIKNSYLVSNSNGVNSNKTPRIEPFTSQQGFKLQRSKF